MFRIPIPARLASRLLAAVLCCAAAALALPALGHAAQPPVDLGGAGSFAVLGGSTVTNTGPSVLTGDLGVSPGAAIVGFPPGLVIGATHAADAVASQAQGALTAAYNDAAGRTPITSVPADIGGLTLTAGVYNSASAMGLTGDVTLDAEGDPGAVFIFQAGSTLITASGSRVLLVNGASPCNVFWQVGSSATLGTATAFNGNVMALTSITATTGATVNGRLLARNGAVTLDTNVVTRAPCNADISVVKTGPATVDAGGRLTWTVTTTNNGPAGATGVKLVDTLPPGTTFVSADPGCTAASGVVTCDIGVLAGGASATRQITVQVPGDAAGTTLTNTATGSATQVDDTPANNTATATTQVVASTDLGVTKTGPSRVTAGGAVAWTIVATNAGPSTATGVTVTDPIPAGATVTTATPTQGTCTVTATTVTCALGTLASGASAQIRIAGTVAASATGSLANTATITGEQPDTTPGNNTSTTTATVQPPTPGRTSVSLRKRASLSTTTPGHTVRYRISVTNTGTITATRVVVCDTLPSRLSYVSVDGATVRGRTACWTIARLGAGRTRVFHVVARVNRSATPGTTVNVAVVRAGNAAHKTAKAPLRIRPGSGNTPAFTG